MDDTKILERTYVNMKQIDKFFSGSEYQCLIDISIVGPTDQKKTAEVILNQLNLIDSSLDFFTKKREWRRCYTESVKLVSILRDFIDDKYKPV